nr:hypothetical protein KPFJINZV_KPFJINZV_CDS_0006 [Gokushovirinae sp.]
MHFKILCLLLKSMRKHSLKMLKHIISFPA